MNPTGIDLYLQAIVAVLVMVDPVLRPIFFRALTENEPERRSHYVRTIMITVAITLGVSAVAGKELLEVLGVDLGAFGVAGGLVLALMGFEMLFGGEPSRAQGGSEAHQEEHPKSAADEILIPYSVPFMAGPGAITTVITLSSSTGNGEGTLAALVAVAVAVALIPVGHLWLVNKLNLSDNAIAIVTRFGGLLIATIGIQLMLGGIASYFEIG